MSKIAIVTDSTSDLTDELIQKYNIKVLPLRVVYKKGEYKDRVDITPAEICARFDEEIPTTSLPSPQDAMELFSQLKQEGYTHIIVTTISSGLSGTIDMIKNVAGNFEDILFDIIDSKALSVGLGFPVLEGAKELERTNDFAKAAKRIKDSINKTNTFFVVKTLEYLKKGGRIGKVEGTIGELLDIKPIISINEDGIYYTYKKVRGRNKSIEKMLDIVKEKAKDAIVNIAVAHSNAYNEAQGLLNKIKELNNINEIIFTQISPVMVVHTGPGLIGVVVSEVF